MAETGANGWWRTAMSQEVEATVGDRLVRLEAELLTAQAAIVGCTCSPSKMLGYHQPRDSDVHG